MATTLPTACPRLREVVTSILSPIQSRFSYPLSLQIREGLAVIGQIFIRALFPLIATVALASVTPGSLLALQIPVSLLGFSFLSAFFFASPDIFYTPPLSESTTSVERAPRLLKSYPAPAPREITREMPRGFSNRGSNCWLNACLQLIQSDPVLAAWARTPPRDADQSAEADLQRTLCQFFQMHDQAVVANRAVSLGFSQQIREALHGVSPAFISPDAREQVDLDEGMKVLLSAAPPEAQIRVQMRNHRVAGSFYTTQFESTYGIQLPISPSRPNPTLEDLLQDYSHETLGAAEQSATGIQSREILFDTLPQTLRIYLSRFGFDRPPTSVLSQIPRIDRAYPPLQGESRKVTTPVIIPYEMRVPLSNQTSQSYRLKAFSCHSGGREGGHYTVFRREGANWYHINDSSVILAEMSLVNAALTGGDPYAIWYERT